jgi:hypothetical protein
VEVRREMRSDSKQIIYTNDGNILTHRVSNYRVDTVVTPTALPLRRPKKKAPA